MNLPKLTEDLNIISSLPNRPTETPEELKAKFDEAGGIIKNFLNNVFIDKLNSELTEALETMQKQITTELNNTRPIGSLYITTTEENPSTIWSGTQWEKIQDKFLLASGTKQLGVTGGSENVTLKAENIPAHTHTYTKTTGTIANVYDNTYSGVAVNSISSVTDNTSSVGQGKAIDIMPPYLVVNVWKRVS